MSDLFRIPGSPFTVAKPYASAFNGLLGDLTSAGYAVDPSQSGGYNYRNINGTNRLSTHAFGRAIDINWTDNARGTRGKIPADLARSLAKKWGMTWGGDWNNPDPMHFEVSDATNAVPVSERSFMSYAGLGGPKGAASAPASSIPPILQSEYGRQSGPNVTPPTPQPSGAPAMASNSAPSNLLGPLSSLKSYMMSPLTMMGMSILASPTREASEGARIALATRGQDSDLAERARRQKIEEQAMAEAEAQKQAWRGLLDDPQNFEGLPPAAGRIAKALPPTKGGELLLDLIQKKQMADSSYGKSGTIVQGGDGKFYSVQFGADGSKKVEPLAIGDQSLSPARGTEVVGDTLINKATGAEVRNVAPNLAGAEEAKVVGKETGERRMMMPKAQASLASANAKTDIVLSKISQARPMVSNWSVGPGALLSSLPGTMARNLKETTATIVANLGFEELQDMRTNSPTGGALGQVAVQELEMLQKTKTSLDQAQTVGQFMQALDELEKIVAASRSRRQAAFAATYGGETNAPQNGSAPAPSNGGFSIRKLD